MPATPAVMLLTATPVPLTLAVVTPGTKPVPVTVTVDEPATGTRDGFTDATLKAGGLTCRVALSEFPAAVVADTLWTPISADACAVSVAESEVLLSTLMLLTEMPEPLTASAVLPATKLAPTTRSVTDSPATTLVGEIVDTVGADAVVDVEGLDDEDCDAPEPVDDGAREFLLHAAAVNRLPMARIPTARVETRTND